MRRSFPALATSRERAATVATMNASVTAQTASRLNSTAPGLLPESAPATPPGPRLGAAGSAGNRGRTPKSTP